MLSQRIREKYFQSIDKVNTLWYIADDNKVNTPWKKEGESMAQMLIRPPDDLKDRLQAEARQKGLTLNALVLNILWDWAQRDEQGK